LDNFVVWHYRSDLEYFRMPQCEHRTAVSLPTPKPATTNATVGHKQCIGPPPSQNQGCKSQNHSRCSLMECCPEARIGSGSRFLSEYLESDHINCRFRFRIVENGGVHPRMTAFGQLGTLPLPIGLILHSRPHPELLCSVHLAHHHSGLHTSCYSGEETCYRPPKRA